MTKQEEERVRVHFRVKRHRPDGSAPAQLTEYDVSLPTSATVLDGLERIRLEEEPGLIYRHSCHHASCGTCACLINGLERLACVTTIAELEGEVITVEPLPGFPVEADLVVDMVPFYRDLDEEWSSLRTSETSKKKSPPDDLKLFSRLEDCIECGICVAVCPAAAEDQPFMGPAALAALNRQLQNHPEEEESLLRVAGNERGESLCQRAIDCSKRCPSKVSPARHIAELRRLVSSSNES